MITPRYYQEEALTAIYQYFLNGGTGNPLIGLPTGTGKSLIPAIFIERVLRQWPNQRFLMVTHVKELIAQNANVLISVWPEAPLGIYSAGLKLKQTAQPIIFGGIQSMIRNAALFGHRDIAFVDEAHLISDIETSQYRTFFALMKLINPNLKIIGMSAVLFRMGMGKITSNGLFTDIVYDRTNLESFNQLVQEGFISPLIPIRTKVELDISDVSIQQGEFVATQLQGAVDKAEITYKALQELVHAGQNRRVWLIFASGIEHAEHIAEQLGAFGIDCAPVHSKRPSEYNDAAIKAFKGNSLRAIVNYGKLTTGFDHPEIDLIGMIRPTLSVPLWVQMLGRGTRPAEGKSNCIAKGSLVLTNNGLIPIEKISIDDKVWDGVEFVTHTGIIYQGYKEVIEYEGLRATMDHNVSTKDGWKTFRESREKGIRIKVTGIDRKPIRETENLFSGNIIQKENVYSSTMYSLQNYFIQNLYKRNKITSWLYGMWKICKVSKSSSGLASRSLQCCKRSLYKFQQYALFRLWRERHTVQFQQCYGNSIMGYGQYRTSERYGVRQKKQQWPLSSWKLKMVNQITKHVKPQISKEHVFDITNAGKYNRFTVNGLLVSNCLVLDFARNTPRLGPINDPQIPKMKKGMPGEMPIKICESCGTYNHTKVRNCVNCGQEFTFQVKIVSNAGTEELIKNAVSEPTPIVETLNVMNAIYTKHDGKIGKPPTIRATYFTPQPYTEYVCLEHSGMAGKIARDWWRRRHKEEPPATVDAALLKISELRCPRFIRVHTNKKWPEILGAEF